MDTSVRVAHGMTRGRKGRGPRGAIGDTDSRSTSGPDPAAGDIRIVTGPILIFGIFENLHKSIIDFLILTWSCGKQVQVIRELTC